MSDWERIEQNLPAYNGRKRNFEFFNEIKFHTIIITISLFGLPMKITLKSNH